MASVNKVILIGNLGADPEVKYTQSGKAVATLRIATNETWTDKDGQKQERVEWHAVTVWGRDAENAGQYLRKGSSVYVEGRLQSREYEDKEGVTRKVWEVQCDRMQFLGGRGDSDQRGGDDGRGGAQRGGGDGRQSGGGGRGGNGAQGGGGWGGGGARSSGGWGGGGGRDAGPRSEQRGGSRPGDDDPIPF